MTRARNKHVESRKASERNYGSAHFVIAKVFVKRPERGSERPRERGRESLGTKSAMATKDKRTVRKPEP